MKEEVEHGRTNGSRRNEQGGGAWCVRVGQGVIPT